MPPGAGPSAPRPPTSSSCCSDPARCQVALVTLPEEMPVNEAIEAAYELEDKVGIALGPVIVNGCYPPLDGLDVPAAEAAAAAGVALDPELLAALDAARTFRLTRQSSRRSSSDGWPASCPFPSCRSRSCSPPPSARGSSMP